MAEEDRRYWFPAKRWGWGWGPPSTWQGWVTLIAWFVVLLGGAASLRRHGYGVPVHIAWLIAMSLVLTFITWWKGEPPRWRWGERSP
jgi:hypothetical protein